MKQKISLDKIVTFIALAIAGAVLAQVAFNEGGIELLLAGVVITLFMEGAMTIMFPNRWCGFVYHLLWAGVFYWYNYKTQAMLDGWQWYLLWGLFVVRIVVIQPIYLVKISKKTKLCL